MKVLDSIPSGLRDWALEQPQVSFHPSRRFHLNPSAAGSSGSARRRGVSTCRKVATSTYRPRACPRAKACSNSSTNAPSGTSRRAAPDPRRSPICTRMAGPSFSPHARSHLPPPSLILNVCSTGSRPCSRRSRGRPTSFGSMAKACPALEGLQVRTDALRRRQSLRKRLARVLEPSASLRRAEDGRHAVHHLGRRHPSVGPVRRPRRLPLTRRLAVRPRAGTACRSCRSRDTAPGSQTISPS